MPLSPAVRVRYDNTVQAAVPNTALFQFYPCLRCHLTVTPLAYKRRPMRNVEGGGHSRSVLLAARVYCSTQRPRARKQYKPQSSSRVLRIRAARSWVNPSCASSRSALRAASAPRQTRKGLGPHRCSRGQISPDKASNSAMALARKFKTLRHDLKHWSMNISKLAVSIENSNRALNELDGLENK